MNVSQNTRILKQINSNLGDNIYIGITESNAILTTMDGVLDTMNSKLGTINTSLNNMESDIDNMRGNIDSIWGNIDDTITDDIGSNVKVESHFKIFVIMLNALNLLI